VPKLVEIGAAVSEKKCEFGRDLMINYRVIPLEEIFSFHSLTLVWMYV
jgi:hypothetical protein